MTETAESDPFAPLRRDVSNLGRLLGDVLVEQEGARLFEGEEAIRRLTKARRTGRGRARATAELRASIGELESVEAERIGRAFAHYFQLVNLAEQRHRVRRYRDYERAGESPLGPLADLVALLKEIPRDKAEELLARASIDLVFTAHPTEAQRRTVLDKHRRIAELLDRLERDPGTTPGEQRAATEAIREEITLLWQTDEIRHERPRVADEVKNVLFYLEDVLYPLIPAVYEALERALFEAYGRRLRVPPILRFGSWVGADMDGNPNVTPETAVDTAMAQAARAVALHARAVEALGARLSQSARRAEASPELFASLERDQAIFARSPSARPSPRADEPYRWKLSSMAVRLAATRAVFVKRRRGESPEIGVGYASPHELREDLGIIERSLAQHRGAHAGLAAVRAVARQVEVFGFHLAKLDVRVPAEWVREAVRRALSLPEASPLSADVLRRALLAEHAPAAPDTPGMLAMQALATMRRHATPESAEAFILSMTRGCEDLLGALLLARIAGLYAPGHGSPGVSIVPLFETLDDLRRCPDELRRALTDPVYERYVASRGGTMEVMIGYSDSNKDAGIIASSFALHEAQRAIVEIERTTDVRITVFHGRGGSIGRGGGSSRRAIEGLPAGAIDGRFKLTEQGEVLGWKYLLSPIALRNLEQTLCGVLGASLSHTSPSASAPIRPEHEAAMARAAEVSLGAYRALVGDEGFEAYFRESTPLDEIGALPLGSRPARRGGPSSLVSLRAIPWGFAWNQSRQMIPGWFGAGRALDDLVRTSGAERARAMYRGWPFFSTMLDAITVALAISDLRIAREYASLVDDPALGRRLYRTIARDYVLATRAIRKIAGRPTLLAEGSTLARTIELRNPYVDALSFIQVELLRRKRALVRAGQPVPPDLEHAILLTINGVASGLRNTG